MPKIKPRETVTEAQFNGQQNVVWEVLCPDCKRKQKDEGKGKTCSYCGVSPLPSYYHPEGHWLHPASCRCEPGVDYNPLPVRERKTKRPSLG